MAAILIPKFNNSAFSISAYPLEAGAVTVNGEVLEWQARKGIQVTHCSLTGQWISVELTPISFMGCNISLFALQVLLNILLGNSKFLCTHMTVTLPADASHLRERHSRNLLLHYFKALLFQFSVDTPKTSASFSNSVRSTCASDSVSVCANSTPPPLSRRVCRCRACTWGSLYMIWWCRWCLTIMKCLMELQPEARCWTPHQRTRKAARMKDTWMRTCTPNRDKRFLSH